MKELAEVVFVPLPAMGHIVAVMEFAKLLVQRDDRLSATVLIMHPTLELTTGKYAESIAGSNLPNRMRVIDLPHTECVKSDAGRSLNWISSLVEGHKRHVREYVTKNIRTQSEMSLPESSRLTGFVFDMTVTEMKDVANEFGVPWYVFYASGAAFLGCVLHLLTLHDEQGVDLTGFKNSDAVLVIPSLVNPLPARMMPSLLFKKESVSSFLEQARRLTEAKGILVNTFLEFELHAVNSLSADAKTPSVYPVGPIVKLKGDGRDVQSDGSNSGYKKIMEWLDDQPVSSVMFLCFGSWGSFSEKQVKEIACALEDCGHRFLWSLRKPAPKGEKGYPPTDYVSFEEILPDGFLIRTSEIGKVIGWAPQVDILAHPAVGGFASHCGWNSTLESVRYGVPVAAWPLYAEQQFNAFQMVIELGLAVDIKMDYIKNSEGTDNEVIVSADDVIKVIKHVMEQDSEIRRKMKEMSRISKKTLTPGGSSYSSMGRFIDDMIDNIP